MEVAKLILPRGSTLLAANTTSVEQPPKDTPLGPVDIPPQTYYTCGERCSAAWVLCSALCVLRQRA